jgi:hypothetical protein
VTKPPTIDVYRLMFSKAGPAKWQPDPLTGWCQTTDTLEYLLNINTSRGNGIYRIHTPNGHIRWLRHDTAQAKGERVTWMDEEEFRLWMKTLTNAN